MQDDLGFTNVKPSLIAKGLSVARTSPAFHSIDSDGSYSINLTPPSALSSLVSSDFPPASFVKNELLERMDQGNLKGVDLDQIISILDSAVLSRNSKEAQSAFDYIGKCRLEATVDCYNLLIKAFIRADDLESAQNVFKKMQLSNVAPNDDSYITIFFAYVDAGGLDTASSLEKQWRTSGVLLPQRVYIILIQALIKRKEYRRVYPSFD